VHYFGRGSHAGRVSDLAYHNSFMVQIWSALATRDARLMSVAMSGMSRIPTTTAWATYLRCHDDIGWAVTDEDAAEVGLSGFGHRAFLSDFYSGRFANTFAMLYASGIPVLDSIRSTQDVVGNLAVREGLVQAEGFIREGKSVTQAFRDVGLFPPLVIRMLRVGENTGGLDRALANVSYFYNRDVRESVERAQAMIEPLLTLLLGALLGWIMLSVIGPIYDVITGIKA
jgi:hypothetical protein